MKPNSDIASEDEMRESYDFTSGVRGQFYDEYVKGTNVVLLDPDVAEVFHDSETVNQVLRTLISKNEVPTPHTKQS